MTDQSTLPTSRRRAPWRRIADLHGVTPRTMDRWVAAGIYPAPEYINGRKYGDLDASPQHDQERQEAAG